MKKNRHEEYLRNREKNLERRKQYVETHREQVRLEQKTYYEKNRERLAQYQREYRQLNKQKLNEKKRIYIKKKEAECLAFKLRRRLRQRLYQIARGNAGDVSAIRHLGCTVQQLRIHLEAMFHANPKTKEAMAWSNWGRSGWHIDHKIPLSSAGDNAEIAQKLCHYTNLQPLWAKDNQVKGDR